MRAPEKVPSVFRKKFTFFHLLSYLGYAIDCELLIFKDLFRELHVNFMSTSDGIHLLLGFVAQIELCSA
jgi:hypothetical protein